jgi:hypothetical protein
MKTILKYMKTSKAAGLIPDRKRVSRMYMATEEELQQIGARLKTSPRKFSVKISEHTDVSLLTARTFATFEYKTPVTWLPCL